MNETRILVLGVGNILLKDEGVGVRVVHHLLARYRFSSNVELMDGGTLGLRLLDPVSRADRLIVVDAVQNGHPSGTLYRLPVEELEKRLTFKNSLHQLDLVETLAFCDLLGHRPQAVIIGIEPADISPWGTELTDAVQARFIEMCTMVLDEIEEAGGSCSLREDPAPGQRDPCLSREF
jgi:hydrogenase maturation protease